MKRYIKATFDPWASANLSEWSDKDIEIWNNTDWKARNYDELVVPEDSFEGTLLIYGIPGGVRKEPVTFVKVLRANTIYSPIYTIPDWWESELYQKYKDMGYTIYSPSCDGRYHTEDGVRYRVADRCETAELYDMLTR